MKTRFAALLVLICALAFTTASYAGISVSSPGVTCGWFTIWYGLGNPHPGKIAYVAVRKPNGYYYTVAQAENVSDYSQQCQVYADLEGYYTFYYDYSDSTDGTPRTNVLQQTYYIQLRNRIQWDPDGTHLTAANPNVERPGQISTITAGFKNTGPSTWGGNHYIEFKDHYGTPIYYASVSGVSPNVADTRNYAVTLPNLGGVGTATYHLRAEENNVEMFGPIRDVPIGVDYPPNTSLAISTTSLPGAGSVQLTSVTTAPYGDLINQAIDYIPPGGTWQSNTVSGTASAGTRWDGGSVGSHTLAPWIQVTTPGTWQFRARGQNSRGQLSNFQYQSVTVAAGAPPITSIAANSGSLSVTGNTNSTAPTILTVNIGDPFTITANSSDSSNDLTSQQFDLSVNGGPWSLGNSSNARLWQGAATGSNTLAKTFNSAELGAGTYRFRAQATDLQNQASTYQYVDVRIAPAPVTTLTASSGASSATGNTNGVSPPALSVTLGQPFTISATTTDADNDLTTQQFDLSINNGAWSLGNTTNARLWQGGPTGTNTLAKTFSSSELGIGTYRFRAQGADARNQYSIYQYIDVVVNAPVAPTIVSHPSSTTVNAGQAVTFSVSANGTQPLYYQWKKNGVNIAGATAASHTIASTQSADAANSPGYVVTVTNAVGSVVSNPATLVVNSLPAVRLALQYWQSGDYPNREYGGDNVWTENVWHDGECHSEYGWYDSDGDGEDDTEGDHEVCSDSGYWDDYVWVPNYEEDGLYGSRWDTTVGMFGDPRSSETGAYNPAQTDRGYLLNQYQRAYEYITFRTWGYVPAGSVGSYQARLYDPSGNLRRSGTFYSGGYWECQFPDWTWGDGVYRIEISFSGATGTSTSSGTVTYYLPLNVTRPPGSTIAINKTAITSGDTVQISVNATAPGNLRYVNVDQTSPNWGYYGYMGSSDIGTETPPSGDFLDVGGNLSSYTRTLTLTLTTPNTYTFRSAVSEGSGWYYSSNTVSVTVSGSGPTIIAQPQSQTAALGSVVAFSVAVSGAPSPTYQWRKGGVNIAGGTGSTYNIASIQSSDAGNYDVVVTNSLGTATSAVATLTVGPAPVVGLEVHRP